MDAVRTITSSTVVLSRDNIDTDQIIPARYLTTTGRSGLGRHLFADWRFDAAGKPRPGFPLNDAAASASTILVAGHNFGCGSSREHAPWALMDFGIRAVISTGIADIFRSNALRNGLVPVVIDKDSHRTLVDNPGAVVTIDLETCVVSSPDGRAVPFEIEPFARYCLIEGIDPLGYLLSREAEIRRFEEVQQWRP